MSPNRGEKVASPSAEIERREVSETTILPGFGVRVFFYPFGHGLSSVTLAEALEQLPAIDGGNLVVGEIGVGGGVLVGFYFVHGFIVSLRNRGSS